MVARTTKPLEPRLPRWGVQVLESHHAQNFHMEVWKKPFHIIAYVLHGSGSWEHRGLPQPCASGDIISVPIGQPYRFIDAPDDPMSLYILCAAAHVGTLQHLGPVGAASANPMLARQVRELLRRMFFEQTLRRPGYTDMLVALAMQVLVLLNRAPARSTATTSCATRVEQYLARLPQTFYEPQSLDDVAANLDMSRRRFTQLFRARAGISWRQHLLQIRLAHAQNLLTHTRRSVISIAYESGFADLSNFYRAFRTHTHLSPLAWRQKQKV